MSGDAASLSDWRPWLRRKLVWLLVVKLAALIAIKSLFFSGEHAVRVTPERMDARLLASSQPQGGGSLRANEEVAND